VILAFLTGSIVFKAACWTGHGMWVLPLITALIWLVGLYCIFAKSILSLAAVFIVALTPFKLVALCPSGTIDVAAAAEGEYNVIKANVLAILFVSAVQYLLAYDRPSLIAVDSVDKAFKDMRKAFDFFWQSMESTHAMTPVSGSLDFGASVNASAVIEPRLFRYPWRGAFFDQVVAQLRQVRLDILMMALSMQGSDGKPDAIFTKINAVPEFRAVRDDLQQTIEDAHILVCGLLACEGATYDGLKFVKDLETLDQLDALPGLIENLSKGGIGFPMELASSLEDDELCQISAVFFMLQNSVQHIAGLIKTTVQYT